MHVCATGQGGCGAVDLLESARPLCSDPFVQVHKKDKVVSVDVHPLDENLVLTAGEKCGRKCVKEAGVEGSWPEGWGEGTAE